MPAAPLDTLESALNTARVRLLDAMTGLAGDILVDSNPATLVAVNAAWRRLQELLVNFGFSWLEPERIIVVPACSSVDPGVQVSIGWTGYSNGVPLAPPAPAPALPQDLIAPISLWERAMGNGSFYPMDKLDNGLPAVPKRPFNGSWEWRNGAIYLPGATQATDVRIRYSACSPDFVAPGTLAFSLQTIPIVRAMNALAWFICAEFAKPRGDMDAGDFEVKGQLAAQFIFNLDPTKTRPAENEKPPVALPVEKGKE
jgi:hypothetical protein